MSEKKKLNDVANWTLTFLNNIEFLGFSIVYVFMLQEHRRTS